MKVKGLSEQIKQQDITAVGSSMNEFSPVWRQNQKCKNDMALHMYLHRVTDSLPVSLPLDDVICSLLTVTMKENVSSEKTKGTTLHHITGHRKKPFPQIWSDAGRNSEETSALQES